MIYCGNVTVTSVSVIVFINESYFKCRMGTIWSCAHFFIRANDTWNHKPNFGLVSDHFCAISDEIGMSSYISAIVATVYCTPETSLSSVVDNIPCVIYPDSILFEKIQKSYSRVGRLNSYLDKVLNHPNFREVIAD